jgi:hypothetical protein
MTPPSRRLVLAAAGAAGMSRAAVADDAVILLQVVGPRGNVLIGVAAQELDAWGRGGAVTVVAERLIAAGTITVWQYAVGRAADGSLRPQPRERIALLRNDAIRIEPYRAAHPVMPPPR